MQIICKKNSNWESWTVAINITHNSYVPKMYHNKETVSSIQSSHSLMRYFHPPGYLPHNTVKADHIKKREVIFFFWSLHTQMRRTARYMDRNDTPPSYGIIFHCSEQQCLYFSLVGRCYLCTNDARSALPLRSPFATAVGAGSRLGPALSGPLRTRPQRRPRRWCCPRCWSRWGPSPHRAAPATSFAPGAWPTADAPARAGLGHCPTAQSSSGLATDRTATRPPLHLQVRAAGSSPAACPGGATRAGPCRSSPPGQPHCRTGEGGRLGARRRALRSLPQGAAFRLPFVLGAGGRRAAWARGHLPAAG